MTADLRPSGPDRPAGTARHWPRLVVTAVLDAVIGVLALAWPGVTVLVLALVLGLVLLLSGTVSIGFGLRRLTSPPPCSPS